MDPLTTAPCTGEGCELRTLSRYTWERLPAARQDALRAEGVRKMAARGMCRSCYDRGGKPRAGRERAPQVCGELMLLDWNWLHETGELDPKTPLKQRVWIAAPRIGMSVPALEKALERAGIRNPVEATLPPRLKTVHDCHVCLQASRCVGVLQTDLGHAVRRAEQDPDSASKRALVVRVRQELADAIAHRDWHADSHGETEAVA